MTTTPPGYTFCYYVSGHGFGHATRVNQIITELLRSPFLVPEQGRDFSSGATASTSESLDTPTGHTIYIVSDAPQFIFQDVIALGAIYRNAKVDAGVVQPLAYSVDRQKTIEGVKAFLARRDEMIRLEVEWLAEVGADCVLADAPFLPCAAASAHGIPACLITNFTFDEVYRFLREGDPLDKDVMACSDAALEDYKKASLLLRLPGSIDIPSFEDEILALESNRSNGSPSISDMDDIEDELPSSKGSPNDQDSLNERDSQHADRVKRTQGTKLDQSSTSANISPSACSSKSRLLGHGLSPKSPSGFPRKAVDVPLVVRKAINSREDVLRALGVDDETIATKKMVLVSFGGQRLKQGWGNPLPEGWIGVICGLPVEHELPEGFYRSPHGVYVPDLTHAADIVIGKLGYGTCSECIAHSTPLIYVPRPQFVEEHGLIKMMIGHGLPVEMTAEEFETGLWQRSILEADRQAQEEREGRRLFMESCDEDFKHHQLAIDRKTDGYFKQEHAKEQRERQSSARSSLMWEQSVPGSGSITQGMGSLRVDTTIPASTTFGSCLSPRARSLAESVNMGEMARAEPLSPIDPHQPPHEQSLESRRSASASAFKVARSRSCLRRSLEGKGDADGKLVSSPQSARSLDFGKHERGEVFGGSFDSSQSGVVVPETVEWFERRIPHNGGEVCARLVEEFVGQWREYHRSPL